MIGNKWGEGMKLTDLINQIARLESVNDQLLSEREEIDQMLKEAGFDDGIQTLKGAVQEFMEFHEEDNNALLN